MAETTKIEWADATVNMWWGCTKVSPACRGCYAEALAKRWGKDVWGAGVERERKAGEKLARKLNRQAEREGRTLRVFSASMSDWLDDEVPAEWLADLLALVTATPNLDWLLLSKRPHLWRARLTDALQSIETDHARDGYPHEPETHSLVSRWLAGAPPANVWLGVTVEDQKRADERIPRLLEIPARVRFLSCEPLLEVVDLGQWLCDECNGSGRYFIDGAPRACVCVGAPGIDWIIAGGESGPNARPSHPDWFRSLRDQAVAAGVAFHFKQWGEWGPPGDPPWGELPVATFENEGREGLTQVFRVGRKAAGRELDGRTWDELPRTVRA